LVPNITAPDPLPTTLLADRTLIWFTHLPFRSTTAVYLQYSYGLPGAFTYTLPPHCTGLRSTTPDTVVRCGYGLVHVFPPLYTLPLLTGYIVHDIYLHYRTDSTLLPCICSSFITWITTLRYHVSLTPQRIHVVHCFRPTLLHTTHTTSHTHIQFTLLHCALPCIIILLHYMI